MQQELILNRNSTQKDLFRNSNWKKFVNLILTLITRHSNEEKIILKMQGGREFTYC